jgi:hypothetical protein
MPAEHGGEFIDTRHVHLRGLARELGLQLDDWAVLVAEDDLSGPLSDLVTAVLAMGETRLWPGTVTVVNWRGWPKKDKLGG